MRLVIHVRNVLPGQAAVKMDYAVSMGDVVRDGIIVSFYSTRNLS